MAGGPSTPACVACPVLVPLTSLGKRAIAMWRGAARRRAASQSGAAVLDFPRGEREHPAADRPCFPPPWLCILSIAVCVDEHMLMSTTATTTTLLTLPEDALALLLANLSLPSDGGALRATAAFFARGGAGDDALACACQLVAARTLSCLPADVLHVIGATAQDEDDWLRTAALVLRMHRHGERAACSNHTLIVAAGHVAACGANEAGQLGNGSVSQFSSTICSQVGPTYSVSQYQARRAT